MWRSIKRSTFPQGDELSNRQSARHERQVRRLMPMPCYLREVSWSDVISRHRHVLIGNNGRVHALPPVEPIPKILPETPSRYVWWFQRFSQRVIAIVQNVPVARIVALSLHPK
jgi:hypothetical protein